MKRKRATVINRKTYLANGFKTLNMFYGLFDSSAETKSIVFYTFLLSINSGGYFSVVYKKNNKLSLEGVV